MMLKDLEIKKILNDVNYWKNDFLLKKKMVDEIELIFNVEMDNFFIKYPKIKNMWDSFNNNDIVINHKNDIDVLQSFDDKKKNPKKTDDIKKLYRDIVKITHPDKISNNIDQEELNKRILIYNETVDHYNNNDLKELLYISNDLGLRIDVDIFLKLKDEIQEDIKKWKKNSLIFESSIYWKWYLDNDKDEILKDFIYKKLNQHI